MTNLSSNTSNVTQSKANSNDDIIMKDVPNASKQTDKHQSSEDKNRNKHGFNQKEHSSSSKKRHCEIPDNVFTFTHYHVKMYVMIFYLKLDKAM